MQAGAEVDNTDAKGETALHVAASKGDAEIAKLLIQVIYKEIYLFLYFQLMHTFQNN